MQNSEQKKIVIKLPNLHWKSFLSVPFFLFFSLICSSLAGIYWYRNVYPYFRFSSAYLNAYTMTLNSDQRGQIVEMGPNEGEQVQKGQILFAFNRDLPLLKQAQTKLALETFNQQVEFEKGRIGKAMDAYLLAENEIEMGMGSQERIQRQLNLMEEAQHKSEEALSQAEKLKKELHLLELELKKTTYVAPFNGIVLKRFNDEGKMVAIGEPIYTLCDPSRFWVEVEIPESTIRFIQLGTSARIQIPAYPNKEWQGKVSSIGSGANIAQKVTIPVKISIENPAPFLKPGLSAKIFLKVR